VRNYGSGLWLEWSTVAAADMQEAADTLIGGVYMEVRRGIWDHSLLLPICPADGHYALVAPVV